MTYELLLYVCMIQFAIPLVGALANYADGYVRPRAPRLADFLAALFPHVADAIRAAVPPPSALPRLPGDKP